MGPAPPICPCVKLRALFGAVFAAVFAAGCGAMPSGLVKVDVSEDGSVSAYLTDEAGGIVYYDTIYLQVRGERTGFNYAGAEGQVVSLCDQLPSAGPLELRMTATFDQCPEVHVAAYHYEPPTRTKYDGTKVPADDVPVPERCSTYQTLLHSTFWLPGGCEEVRSETAP